VAPNQSLKIVARQRREFPRLVGEVLVDTNLGEVATGFPGFYGSTGFRRSGLNVKSRLMTL
jgi:hypothetical protein